MFTRSSQSWFNIVAQWLASNLGTLAAPPAVAGYGRVRQGYPAAAQMAHRARKPNHGRRR
jgi:hypothetical protein